MPQVTVIIPNFNHARFLDRRIQSVLNQTFTDFEVLFLDDASTDNSREVFERYSHDPRVRSLQNLTNSGSAFKQWNKGVREARGKYIWIAESDDYADEKLLETLVQRLEENPCVGVAYCQSWCVDEEGNRVSTMNWWTDDINPKRWEEDFVGDGLQECRQTLVIKNTIPNASAVVFRKDVYLALGGAEESMMVCGDWMCWVKCLLKSDVAFTSKPLNSFRKHSDSVRSHVERSGIVFAESYQVLDFIRRNCSVPELVMRKSCDRICNDWMGCVMEENSIPLKRNFEIYALARRVDPGLNSKLIRKLAGYMLRKLHLRNCVSRFSRRSGKP